jgi:hypothetical protein
MRLRESKMAKCRKGQAVLELIPSLVMFVTMLSVIFTLCIYLYFQNILITAAREGARVASLTPELATTGQLEAGRSAVIAAVQNFMQQTTGQQLTPEQIEVTAPSGTFGERTVKVAIDYNLTSPVPIPDMSSDYNGDPSTLYHSIPLSASATMHYEE